MTPRRFIPAVLLAASTASAQLLTPATDQLADFHAWFGPLDPTTGLVNPSLPSPAPGTVNSPERLWSAWVPNFPPSSLPGPIVGTAHELFCEVVFLGCTGPGWAGFGYRLASQEYSLTTAPASLAFGDFAQPAVAGFDALDFYVQRADGSRYYAFDKTLNSAPAAGGYWGTIVPLATVRSDCPADAGLPFTIFAFSPDLSATAPELFVFAVAAGYDAPTPPVPEPATYGALAAVVLAASAALRRRRTSGTPPAAHG